jgi:hypothetical protein
MLKPYLDLVNASIREGMFPPILKEQIIKTDESRWKQLCYYPCSIPFKRFKKK